VVLAYVTFIIADTAINHRDDAVDAMKDFQARFYDVTKPVVDTSSLPWAQAFRTNAEAIHKEFLNFEKRHGTAPRISSITSTERKLDSNASHAWRSLFLRVYGRDTIHLNDFPLTIRLVQDIPHDVSLVMFSILEPHYTGKDHHGIYSGVIRYLLGIEVPEKDKCPLHVLGVPHYYGVGEDIFFDDTVEHRVDNFSDKRRVSLFLDVRRDFGHWLPNLINNVVLKVAASLPEVDEAVNNANALSPSLAA
jgi:aspartyl/asparaginyl beta-hydroxylase (cupin superfamily)